MVGDVRVRIVKPFSSQGTLPVVLYVHGGGWVIGNVGTHDRLVRELAVGANAAVVFVEYDRSPEARYPVAIEQAYATARWITAKGAEEGLEASRLAVAGAVGGNMTAALTLMAKQRGDVTFVHQSLYYPVTDAAQDTESYREFANGPYLTAKAMAWFWDCCTTDPAQRAEVTASPLRVSLEELRGLAARARHRRRERRAAGRGGGVYPQADPGRRSHHEYPHQRHPARLHAAQPAPARAVHDCRGRAGHSHPAYRPPRRPRVLRGSTEASAGPIAPKRLWSPGPKPLPRKGLS